MTSLADGTRVQEVGDHPAGILDAHLDGWLTVTDAQVRAAVKRLYRTEGIIAEGAGALAVAAADRVDARRIVAVVSGGNIDRQQFRSLVSREPSSIRGFPPMQSSSPLRFGELQRWFTQTGMSTAQAGERA